MIHIGLERLIANHSEYSHEKVGYLSNQASTAGNLIHGRLLLKKKFGERMLSLFSPQHGFFSEKQDNMIESGNTIDPATGLPVYSLYGEYRKPTAEMFADIDLLFIDLIDVGTRVYTFMWTMAYCMQAAAEMGKRVVILDRPNPIGGVLTEGNVLAGDCSSFVGLYPVPMRHGMTLGELALMFNNEFSIGADLEVIAVDGWRRSQLMRATGFPWLPPSPNMPTPETALVYPGQVIWEGTNISEGRGTTMPFEFVGAPFWNPEEIKREIEDVDLPGCFLRPILFEPTSGKFAGTGCQGFHIYVTDPQKFMPYRTSLALLQASMKLYKGSFEYKKPPYEYEFDRLPLDLILGDSQLRTDLEKGVSITKLEEGWQKDLEIFHNIRENYLLYH